MKKKYYAELVNRVFNVLYTYENDRENFKNYVESLNFELSGNQDFLEVQQIRFRLNALIINNSEHKIVRKTVLKAISILDNLLSNWEE